MCILYHITHKRSTFAVYRSTVVGMYIFKGGENLNGGVLFASLHIDICIIRPYIYLNHAYIQHTRMAGRFFVRLVRRSLFFGFSHSHKQICTERAHKATNSKGSFFYISSRSGQF